MNVYTYLRKLDITRISIKIKTDSNTLYPVLILSSTITWPFHILYFPHLLGFFSDNYSSDYFSSAAFTFHLLIIPHTLFVLLNLILGCSSLTLLSFYLISFPQILTNWPILLIPWPLKFVTWTYIIYLNIGMFQDPLSQGFYHPCLILGLVQLLVIFFPSLTLPHNYFPCLVPCITVGIAFSFWPLSLD